MHIAVLTLFPELVQSVASSGVVGRALAKGIWSLACWNPRDFTTDRHRTVDDRPYGGGPGMVMMAEPLAQAIAAARNTEGMPASPVICLSPQGERLNHQMVLELSRAPMLILLAARYEGIDERLMQDQVDREISLGDYVLSGGELAALVLIDCLIRQLPGVLNDAQSAQQDSFATGLLDCPHYTRPENYRGRQVPEVLLSGDHAAIARWRLQQALGRTWLRRPDLLTKKSLSEQEQNLLSEFQEQYRKESS